MRSLFLIIAMTTFFCFTVFAQKNSGVTEKVTTAFAMKFPDAKNIKWDKENDKEWEAEFKMGGKEYSANFDLEGIWMETEYEIEKSKIPAEVKATLDSEFAGYKIREAEISESAAGKVYEFELKQGKNEAEVVIDCNGKTVKNNSESEDKEGEEDND